MMTMANRVWNRAALDGGGDDARPGDVALASLLLAHGMIMNGGMVHVYEALTDGELKAAIAGYRYFSLDEVADLIGDYRPHAVRLEDDDLSDLESDRIAEMLANADELYAAAVPGDSALVARFEQVYRSHPAEFADL